MVFSKTTRIAILLAIDAGFFFVELIVVIGYSVHSLALVADAFHMLNDVLSLCVGLWAVKRARTGRTTMYTYGWQRAETLGALVNGVFLVALCMSIFLEAIERFVNPTEVTNPELVLIVGCLGLGSNILGLFLFHDHGHGHSHGHGEEGHGHSHGHDAVTNAEEGRNQNTERVQWADETTRLIGDQSGNIEDVLPSVRVAGFKGSPERRQFSKSDETNTTLSPTESGNSYKRRAISTPDNRHRRRQSIFTGSIDDMPVHPSNRRDEIINASQFEQEDQSDAGTDEAVDADNERHVHNTSTNGASNGYGATQSGAAQEYSHAAHKHRQPKETKSGGGGHGHSHGDLNMRGVFLHVLGDALGNVGVIVSALIIWLAKFQGRYYFDPAISLLITFIILYSAIPLCKAAARILLQAVPMGMSIDEIRADIEDLKGITSAHHIHVWQLSDTKLVASLHVRISSEIQNAGTEGYMRLAKEIQQCLKEYGIRSSTIQPEFEWDSEHGQHSTSSAHVSATSSHSGSDRHDTTSKSRKTAARECMLGSEDAGEVLGVENHEADHDHEHDHDHDHAVDSHDHAHDQSNGKSKHNHQH